MPSSRRKVSAVAEDFVAEITRLEQLDAKNQANFSGRRSAKGRVSKKELHFLTEAIVFTACRAYENYVRDIFLLYCQGKPTTKGVVVKSYLKPRDFAHAEELVQSSMPLVNWSRPNVIIERAELYLEDGFPIKVPYSINRDMLGDILRIRNHIAHNSKESLHDYRKVVKKHYGTMPLSTPSPGEFLLLPEKKGKKYKLQTYLALLKAVSLDLS